jgi:signal transduction histidine kinase/CheY-like chemotaxis protein
MQAEPHNSGTTQVPAPPTSEWSYRELFDACPIGMVVIHAPNSDPRCLQFLVANHEADRQAGFGWSSIESGTPLVDIFPGAYRKRQDGQSLAAAVVDVILGGTSFEDARLAYGDEVISNSTFWVRVVRSGPRRATVLFRDLELATGRDSATSVTLKQLRAANEDLQHFSTAIAHDLKNPLSTIIGFAELAGREELSEKTRKLLTLIDMSARRAVGMIDDLLDYSRHAGPSGERVATSLEECLDWAVATLDDQMREHGVSVSRPSRLPTVSANPSAIRQIFMNLLTNSIKYREPARPLRIEVTAGDFEGGMVEVRVHDNGTGIVSDDLEAIFRLGHRSSAAREAEGDGIGLATCRIAVAHHGGRIWANDHEAGACISFTLPAWQGNDTPTMGSVPDRPLSLMLVDDDPIAEFAIQLEIHRIGAEVTSSHRDGQEALIRYESLDEYPDVVVIDLKMPKLDGLSLASAIRRINPTQPIVLRTAHLDDKVRRRAAKLGIEAVVRKQDIGALVPWLATLTRA